MFWKLKKTFVMFLRENIFFFNFVVLQQYVITIIIIIVWAYINHKFNIQGYSRRTIIVL